MKKLLLAALIGISISSKGQVVKSWDCDTITIKLLEESFTRQAQYKFKLDGQGYLYIDKILDPACCSEGWACKITDTLPDGSYKLEYHWITHFNRLRIWPDQIILYSDHTMDWCSWKITRKYVYDK